MVEINIHILGKKMHNVGGKGTAGRPGTDMLTLQVDVLAHS